MYFYIFVFYQCVKNRLGYLHMVKFELPRGLRVEGRVHVNRKMEIFLVTRHGVQRNKMVSVK